jgi:hypothetical protein
MEDAQDGHGVLFVLEQNYVWESVDHGRTQLLVNAAEGFGTLRNRVNAIANRNPKTTSKIDGNVVVVGDQPRACLNSDCIEASAPVCETAAAGSTTVCGKHGLCLADTDCAPTFSCRLLWPDGRKECVPNGGCSSSSECEIQQVCAVPRNLSVAPSCQAGVQP